MYCVLSRRSADNDIRDFPVFLFENPNFIKVEDKFNRTIMHVLRDLLDRFIEKTPWNVDALRFLPETFHFT
jgi:hypothetical protein